MAVFFKKNIFLFFWIIAAIEIISQALDIPRLHFIAKPLLLPLLIMAVLLWCKHSKQRNIIISGLFFSFAGDVFLLLEKNNPLFFIAGLICFLLTHLFYSWYFLQIQRNSPSLLQQKPFLFIPVILYTGCLLTLLIPTLGSLAIPVIIYACLLTGMLLCSLYAFNFMNLLSRKYIISGTVCFVGSDSLLAINKFYVPFAYAGFFIMLTYCLAQYFIVKGFVYQVAAEENNARQ